MLRTKLNLRKKKGQIYDFATLSGIDRLQWPILPAAELQRRERGGRGRRRDVERESANGFWEKLERQPWWNGVILQKKKNSLAETTQHIARQRGKNTVGAKRGPPNAPQVQNADGYMILGRNIWNQDWLGLAKQILIRFSKLLRSSTALELIVLP